MTQNSIQSAIAQLLTFVLLFIGLLSPAFAQTGDYNFYSFRDYKSANLSAWENLNGVQYSSHPEFGVLPEKSPCVDCIEDLSQRTEHQRLFRDINNPQKVYQQTSYGALNEKVDGQWISVRDKLAPLPNQTYENRYQIATIGLNPKEQMTEIKTQKHNFHFNNWVLKVIKGGKVIKEQKADWSNITIGEDGAYITNVFYGIDAEMIVFRGAIKTNFIIRENRYGEFDELNLTDRYTANYPIKMGFADGGSLLEERISKVRVFAGNEVALEIGEARGYVAKNEVGTNLTLPYRIEGHQLSVVVDGDWIRENLKIGNLVIDPMVSSTAALNQNSVTGSKYGATCYNDYCPYDLSVPVLVNTEITDISYSFNYYASSPCLVTEGGYSIHLGNCRAPNMPNVYHCSLAESGVCLAEDISILGNMQNCVNTFYCAPTDLDFELRFYRCNDNSPGCGSDCIRAASDWIITIEGVEKEYTSPSLSDNQICEGEAITGTVGSVHLPTPITYVWSLDANGANIIGNGENPVLNLSGVGSYPIFVTTTDGCNQTHLDSAFVQVNPVYNFVETDTICPSDLPYSWRGQTVASGGMSASTLHYNTISGCDSNYVLNLTVIPTIFKTETITICAALLPYTWNGKTILSGGNNVARDTSISSQTGCDSITTLNLSIEAAIVAYDFVDICDSELPYTWNGKTITNPGVFITASDTTVSVASGCDSITHLILTAHAPSQTNLTVHICHGGSYTYFDSTYTTSGVHTFQYSSVLGCDSTVTLTLIADPIDTLELYQTICPHSYYDFMGDSIQTPGTYYYFQSGECDVVLKLNLSNYDTSRFTYHPIICTGDSLVWGDTVLYETGVYTFSTISLSGCDVLTTVDLTVTPIDTIVSYTYLCPLDSTFFFGNVIHDPGTYFFLDSATTTCWKAYKLVVAPRDTILTDQNEYLCSGDSYNYHGTILSTTGDYTFTGINQFGCDTMHTVHIFIDPPTQLSVYETICENTSYHFFDTTLTQAGTYTHNSDQGCDTTWTLYLSVIDTIRTSANINICEGNSYVWKGVAYTQTGVYNLPGTSTLGCDTLHTLNIVVNPADTVDLHDSLCFSGNFFFYNQPITGPGVYVHRDTTGLCDTVWRLTVDMFDTITTTYVDTFCTGQTYYWKGVAYTTSGVYNLLGINSNGCDTLHILDLYFTPPDTLIQDATICSGQSYYFGFQNYQSSGTYYWNTTSGSCDITYQLNLTVNDTIRTEVYDTICSGLYVFFDGNYYTATGNYYFYGQNSSGCDTLRTLHLLVNPPHYDSTIATICPGDSFNFWGVNYYQTGVYTRSSITEGCDTAYLLFLTVPIMPNIIDTFSICAKDSVVHDGTVLNQTGVYPFHYTSVDGCDSVYTIVMNVVPYMTDTLLDTVCANQIYPFYNQNISAPGTYTFLSTGLLCDTLHVLKLEHTPVYRFEHDLEFCSNDLPASYLGVSIPYGTTSVQRFDSVMLSTIHGCDSLIVLNLTVKDTSRSDLDTLLCYGVSLQFGNNVITAPGVYFDYQTNSVGCDSVVALHVNYTPPPNVTDTFLKNCEIVIYRDSTFYNDAIFIDTFRDVIGCDSEYRHVVIEVPYVRRDTIHAEICQGESYLFNGKQYNRTQFVTASFINDNGCDSFSTLDLTVHPLPRVRLAIEKHSNPVCVWDSVILRGSGAETYDFYNRNFYYLGTSEDAFSSQLVYLGNNGYIIVGTDENGCKDTASAQIISELCCDIQVPNAFSPNQDGLNDGFGPVATGTPKEFKMVIYNRYGQVMFNSYRVDDQWDGTYQNGKKAEVGVYFYRITGKCFDGQPFEYKGDLTLVR